MANSTLITNVKSAVIKELINDEAIFHAINSPTIKDISEADKLVYTHIFPFHQNPEVITNQITFLTLQVHIPKPHDRFRTWVLPRLDIWIFSHNKCMRVDNIPKVTDNRNDYISKLLDKKFNGRSTLGVSDDDSKNVHLYDKLDLIGNVEGAFSKDYLYREMMFEMKDLNSGLCEYE